ncbi:MAG: type I phosphomannose isomerase catalytic subunit [Bacteroidales bacterium]
MNKLYPFKFQPIYKSVIWGGSQIKEFKGGTHSDSDRIGESWEISGLENQLSVVANGEFEGVDIKELLTKFGADILGKDIYAKTGNLFPILIKFLDVSSDLSIQVHPNNIMASERHNSLGKTELWYVIKSDDKSHLYSGFSKTVTKEEFKSHIYNNSVTDILAKFSPKPRDLFYIPAGRIHSICAGNFMVEIQQTSDITYRVYDYDRVDVNGKKRELHTQLASEALDYNISDDTFSHADMVYDKELLLKRCDYFTSSVINLTKSFRFPIDNSFKILVITSGDGKIIDDNGTITEIKQGETILIPAAIKYVDIIPNVELEVLTTFI